MIKRRLNLPKKDKNGIGRLSYSQIKCFKENKNEFINRYILNKPFKSNEYIKFGNKVGNSIQHNNFNNFHELEEEILRKVERLDEFEKFVKLDFVGFVMFGYIDSINKEMTKIIDYKTGGNNKESKYSKEEYTQLCYYALALKQQEEKLPLKAEVHFITRSGNPYKYQDLVVDQKDPIIINVDISEERLKKVYWETIKTAEEIESFYLNYLNLNEKS